MSARSRMVRSVLVVFLSAFCATLPAFGKDDDPAAPETKSIDEATARAAIESFDRSFTARAGEFEAIETVRRAGLVRELIDTGIHPLIIERLGKILRSREPVRVRLAAARALGGVGLDQTSACDRASQELLRVLRSEKNEEVLRAVILSLGKIRSRDAVAPLSRYLTGKYVKKDEYEKLVVSSVKALGEIGGYDALRKLHDAFRYFWKVDQTQPGSRVKTNVDRLVGGHSKKVSSSLPPNPAAVLPKIRDSIENITGERFEDPRELARKMKEMREKLGD